MDRPAVDLVGAHRRTGWRAALVVERRADPVRHLARKRHLEAGVDDLPLDELGRILELGREEVAHLEPARLGGDERRRGAVAELEHGEQLLELLGVLEVQRAELDGHREHPRVGPRARDMVSGAQSRDRGIAAHEADQSALDAFEAEAAGDDLVDPRRDEAGAARHDEMGDPVELRLLAEPAIASSASSGAASHILSCGSGRGESPW